MILGGAGHSLIQSIPMICFTELKISEVSDHTKRYGKLGIGFKREFLMKRGANPVFYCPNALYGVPNTNLPAIAAKADEVDGLNVLLSFIKEMSEQGKDDMLYYNEKEWRLLLTKYGGTYFDWIQERDGHHYCTFSASDIQVLVFPDAETRKRALGNAALTEYFESFGPSTIDLNTARIL